MSERDEFRVHGSWDAAGALRRDLCSIRVMLGHEPRLTPGEQLLADAAISILYQLDNEIMRRLLVEWDAGQHREVHSVRELATEDQGTDAQRG